jgi:hypothetical protein
MRNNSFIAQAEVIEKILAHLGLWPAPSHSPPVGGVPVAFLPATGRGAVPPAIDRVAA